MKTSVQEPSMLKICSVENISLKLGSILAKVQFLHCVSKNAPRYRDDNFVKS